MAWTTPKTWVAGNTLTAAELNEQVRDNLTFLNSKPSADYVLDEASDYTTTSGTFVDIDSTNLSLSITTGGGDVLAWFTAICYPNTTNSPTHANFDIDVDGSRIGGDDGLQIAIASGSGTYAYDQRGFFVVRLITGLSAGSHTFTAQWKVASGWTMPAGAGTTSGPGGATFSLDIHPQFGVREL